MPINSAAAVLTLMAPRASGRLLVRSTSPSNRRSQRSLAMHPAPLTARPPTTMRRTRDADGGADGISQRAQPAGTSRISLPVGLFQRRS